MGAKFKPKASFRVVILPDIEPNDLEIIQDYWLHNGASFVNSSGSICSKYGLTSNQLKLKVKENSHAVVEHGLCKICGETITKQVYSKEAVNQNRKRTPDICDACSIRDLKRQEEEERQLRESLYDTELKAIDKLTREGLEPIEWQVLTIIVNNRIRIQSQVYKHLITGWPRIAPNNAWRTIHRLCEKSLIQLTYTGPSKSKIATISYHQALAEKIARLETETQTAPKATPASANQSSTTGNFSYRYITS